MFVMLNFFLNDFKSITAMRTPAIPSYNGMTILELVEFLQNHHAGSREKLFLLNHRLQLLLRADLNIKGDLLQVYQNFNGFREMLEQHLNKEETILFPFVKEAWKIALSGKADARPQEALLLSPLRIFQAEHLSLLAQMKRIREACDLLRTGVKSSALIRLIYLFLALEKDLNQHIHLGNNLLFPNLLRLGQQIKGRKVQGWRKWWLNFLTYR